MDADHVAMEVIQTSDRGFPETLLAIYCVDQKDDIFQAANYWVMQVPNCLQCCPKMNITFCKRTEYKTTEIARQLELLGEPWVRDAAWHRVLCFPIPPEVDYNLAHFRAIGIGSSCKKRERACRLALAVTVAVYQPLNARYRPEEQLFQRLATRAEAILPRRHPLLWPTTTNALAVPYFEPSVPSLPPQWLLPRPAIVELQQSAQQEQPQTSQPPPLPLMPAGFGLLTQPVSFGPAEHGAAQPEQWQLSQPPPVTNHGGCMATKEVPTYASLPYTGVEH